MPFVRMFECRAKMSKVSAILMPISRRASGSRHSQRTHAYLFAQFYNFHFRLHLRRRKSERARFYCYNSASTIILFGRYTQIEMSQVEIRLEIMKVKDEGGTGTSNGFMRLFSSLHKLNRFQYKEVPL